MSLAAQLERNAIEGVPAARTRLDYPLRTPLVQVGRLRRRRAWTERNGDVLVRAGDVVHAGDAVAHVVTAGRVTALDAARLLGVTPDRVAGSLTRGIGDLVDAGDVLAERRSLGGLQRRTVRSPIAGRLDYVSAETGIIYVEPPAAERTIAAHATGTVVEVATDAVLIESEGLALGGLAGAGPAVAGMLFVVETPADLPVESSEVTGAILACGFALDEATLRRISELGVGAVVACGVEEEAISRLGWDDLLWPDAGAAGRAGIRPVPPLTIVLLAPGPASRPPGIWDLLRGFAGRPASAVGADQSVGRTVPVAPTISPTQIGGATGYDAHVAELLIFVPAAEAEAAAARHLPVNAPSAAPSAAGNAAALAPGARVRVVAGRGEGLSGEVQDLDPTPFRLASEARADTADVAFPYDVHLRSPLLHLRTVR